MIDPVLSARGKIAYAVSRKDAEREFRARQEMSAALVERAIRLALEGTTPLTEEARAALAMLLMAGAK